MVKSMCTKFHAKIIIFSRNYGGLRALRYKAQHLSQHFPDDVEEIVEIWRQGYHRHRLFHFPLLNRIKYFRKIDKEKKYKIHYF